MLTQCTVTFVCSLESFRQHLELTDVPQRGKLCGAVCYAYLTRFNLDIPQRMPKRSTIKRGYMISKRLIPIIFDSLIIIFFTSFYIFISILTTLFWTELCKLFLQYLTNLMQKFVFTINFISWNRTYCKNKIFASSWLNTVNILRCSTVSKT